jgi:hypothetical protein
VWLGFWLELVPPSPKLQDQPVIDPVEASVNWTVSGTSPPVGAAEKPATGAGGLTVMEVVFGIEVPVGPVTVSDTV